MATWCSEQSPLKQDLGDKGIQNPSNCWEWDKEEKPIIRRPFYIQLRLGFWPERRIARGEFFQIFPCMWFWVWHTPPPSSPSLSLPTPWLRSESAYMSEQGNKSISSQSLWTNKLLNFNNFAANSRPVSSHNFTVQNWPTRMVYSWLGPLVIGIWINDSCWGIASLAQ